ncbi:MAG: STAS domain-containing protein [Armatimonadota bacterium]|nr:STAS domain-containing protein [bacterium]
MNVEVVENAHVVVRVIGDVELPNIDALREAIETAVSKTSDGFVIDLSDVGYIDSAGISALVFAYRRINPSGGKLAVVIADKNVRRIISITRLDTLPGICIFEDITSAKNYLTNEPDDQPS